MNPDVKARLRQLPAVTALLEHEEVQGWLAGVPRAVVVAVVQAAVGEARDALVSGRVTEVPSVEELVGRAEALLVRESLPPLRRVINATGIVLHTGLGRAPLGPDAIEALVDGARGYCNLEYDLETGRRGKRQTHVAERLARCTGAEAGTVVNNNAAATLIILNTFARGQEAIVSRGQLVEIGGSFRLPNIMEASGAVLREVGATNRTRLSDYEQAIGAQTGLLLRVHPSNYRIVGFTEEPEIGPLAELGHRYEKLVVDDLGSGVLVDLSKYGLPAEPVVADSIAAGADLVCFSGDKLLGGPQCGVIVGRRTLIHRIEANPLMRAFRVDKLTLLALDATLRHYVAPDEAVRQVPTLRMLTADTDELAGRARALQEQLSAALPGERFLVCSDVSFAGGGALPAQELETVVVEWRPAGCSLDAMQRLLREAEVPVVARVRDGAVCFDLRTLEGDDLEDLVASVAWANLEVGEGLPPDEDDGEPGPGEGISLPILDG